MAKNTLAQSAAQASATAQAALQGKQILLQSVEQQLVEAQFAVQGEVMFDDLTVAIHTTLYLGDQSSQIYGD